VLVLLIVALFGAAPGAFAFGQREDPLVAAEKLIVAQRYNEAILYLTEFIKKYPERFDEAQAKLRKIIEIRETYNQKAKGLLDVLVNEPTNEEKKLSMIKALESLERQPNKDTQNFIAKTKEASLFVFNRARFDEIMAKGRANIDAKLFANAAAVYEEGFALYRDDFDYGPYDELTKSAVGGLIDDVKADITAFAGAQVDLSVAVDVLKSAFNAGDAVAAIAAYPAAEKALVAQALRRNAAVASGRALSRQFDLIKKLDPATTDSSFLPFAFRFTLGRSTSALPEGVVGAMDTQWIELMNGLQTVLDQRLDADFASAEKAYEENRWAEASAGFKKVAALARPGLSTVSLWGLLSPTDFLPAPTIYGKAILSGKSAAYFRISHLQRSALAYDRLAGIAASAAGAAADADKFADGLAKNAPLAASLSELAGYRQILVDSQAAAELERKASQERAVELARWDVAGFGDNRSPIVQGSLDGRIASIFETARSSEIAMAARTQGIEFASIDAELAARKASIELGKRYIEGVAATEGALAGALLRYPVKSVDLLTAEDQQLARFRARAAEFLDKLKRETPYVASASSVLAWADSTRVADRAAATLQTERVALLARAQEQRRQAETARLEAERRTTESRAALGREDFDTARDRLSKARDRYLASLSLSEDPQLRGDSDRLLQRLGEDIVKAENDRVVRETRRLINEGKALYFRGAFDKAEEALLAARARWKTTHGEDLEPEVETWIRLSQTALSVKTGRDIPTTAPLYPEMSQFLSLAKKYFDEGKRLLEQKRKTDALQAFSLARQKLNEVRVIFPLNQEAGVLALRIDQIIDPDAFRRDFGVKFNAARSKIKAKENPGEAYSELQDLSAIDAKYPGMKTALYEAEILLGLRIPPPDPKKAARAKELVAAARRVVDASDATRYPFALEQLNAALDLDPANEAAVALKDRVLTNMGGSAQIVLSNASEALYNQAVELFQNGEYLLANGIMERLLQDAKNKKSQKLQDLLTKIRARL